MTDHAPHIQAIRQRIAETERLNEMEKRTAPLFWLVYVIVALVLAWMIADDYQMRQDRRALAEAIVHLANGGAASVGDDSVMACSVRRVIGEGI